MPHAKWAEDLLHPQEPPKPREPKVKTGVYLESEFYLKLRIFLLQRRPRMGYSEYGEIAIREKFERDTAPPPVPATPKPKGQ